MLGKLHYIWFDGTSYNVGDKQDLDRERDSYTEVVLVSSKWDEIEEKLDELNYELVNSV